MAGPLPRSLPSRPGTVWLSLYTRSGPAGGMPARSIGRRMASLFGLVMAEALVAMGECTVY